MPQRILVTGGAGYIGSHTTLALLEAGYEVVVLDNLSNSSPESLRRVAELCGKQAVFAEVDLLNRERLDTILAAEGPFDACIHFAALKAVGESVREPLRYYHNNVGGTVQLLEALEQVGCRRLIFSSSATVYGDPESVPITEAARTSATNPYGRTKLMMEQVLADLCHADERWRCVLLRYFNPVGAHVSGRIGEDPQGVPNNLMPFISQVAVGRRTELAVFGDDWPTHDGTGVRDYIHVVDLADGHVAALKRVEQLPERCQAINLGTGQGYSVLDMVKAFATASGREVPYRMVGRRPGDIATCYADPRNAEQLLGWKATRGLAEMCADTWRWQEANPNGYAKQEARRKTTIF